MACSAIFVCVLTLFTTVASETSSADARALVDELCVPKYKDVEIDREKSRKTLTASAGGSDILGNAIREANTTDDIYENIGQSLTPGFLLGKAFPFVLFFVMIFVYGICCWTCCPFCRCCRVGAGGEKETPFFVKLCILILFLAIGLCCLILGSVVIAEHTKILDGFGITMCASSESLLTIVDGNSDGSFIGMQRVIDNLVEMGNTIETNSTFMQKLDTLLRDTSPITDSLVQLSGTVSLLETAMNADHNKQPGNTVGELLHSCSLCEEVVKAVEPVIQEIDGSVAKQLSKAREEVERQLTGEIRSDLRKQVEDVSEPLKALQSGMLKVFEGFSGDDVTQARNSAESLARTAAICGITLFLAVVCCGLCSSSVFLIKEKRADTASGNPYSVAVPFCACSSWCLGFYVTFFGFLFGGIFIALTVPTSSVCITLDNLNKEFVTNVAKLADMEEAASKNVANLVDNCINVDGQAGEMTDFMTLVYNGSEIGVREYFTKKIEKPMLDRFSDINTAGVAFSNNSDVQALRKTLRDNPIGAFYLPMRDIAVDDRFKAWFGVHASTAFLTTVHCVNHTVSGQELLGVEELDKELQNYGTATVPLDCGKQTECIPGDIVCTAGTQYRALKTNLRAATNFRCDVFVGQNGQDCDVFSMGGAPTFANDCLQGQAGNKTLSPKEKRCNFAEWSEYVKRFDDRLEKTFARVDFAVAQLQDKISKSLRELVDENIFARIRTMMDGTNCGFMDRGFAGIIDGLCFNSITTVKLVGNAMVGGSILMIITIILAYGLWRRSIDNSNAWEKAN
eukprot:TRINITY_DN17294_c0_g1_i1.p1 TRINITY_DN17294_c0_g1~~TRINITY_DN17294_c0_g1_i1.p1  ORF type:complete len:796 (+),score=140.48 TRINITY_DN17294_c0_g1_i1:61-2448(+)